VISVREAAASDLDQVLQLSIELHEFTAAGVPSRLRVAEAYERAGYALLSKTLARPK
jgi:hypothetical protein